MNQICKNFLSTRSVSITQAKTMIWGKNFVEPIVTKEELKNVQENDPDRFKNLQYNKVKALDSFKNNNLFYDEFLYKLVGRITRLGARERADKLVRETLFLIKKDRLEKLRNLDPSERDNFVVDPIKILKEAWNNCKPILKVIEVTRGGSTYFSPVGVNENDKDEIVREWVREVVENRPRPRPDKFPVVFARELLLAYKNEGKLIKKKLDLYRLCEANKAYVSYVYMKRRVNFNKKKRF